MPKALDRHYPRKKTYPIERNVGKLPNPKELADNLAQPAAGITSDRAALNKMCDSMAGDYLVKRYREQMRASEKAEVKRSKSERAVFRPPTKEEISEIKRGDVPPREKARLLNLTNFSHLVMNPESIAARRRAQMDIDDEVIRTHQDSELKGLLSNYPASDLIGNQELTRSINILGNPADNHLSKDRSNRRVDPATIRRRAGQKSENWAGFVESFRDPITTGMTRAELEEHRPKIKVRGAIKQDFYPPSNWPEGKTLTELNKFFTTVPAKRRAQSAPPRPNPITGAISATIAEQIPFYSAMKSPRAAEQLDRSLDRSTSRKKQAAQITRKFAPCGGNETPSDIWTSPVASRPAKPWRPAASASTSAGSVSDAGSARSASSMDFGVNDCRSAFFELPKKSKMTTSPRAAIPRDSGASTPRSYTRHATPRQQDRSTPRRHGGNSNRSLSSIGSSTPRSSRATDNGYGSRKAPVDSQALSRALQSSVPSLQSSWTDANSPEFRGAWSDTASMVSMVGMKSKMR